MVVCEDHEEAAFAADMAECTGARCADFRSGGENSGAEFVVLGCEFLCETGARSRDGDVASGLDLLGAFKARYRHGMGGVYAEPSRERLYASDSGESHGGPTAAPRYVRPE